MQQLKKKESRAWILSLFESWLLFWAHVGHGHGQRRRLTIKWKSLALLFELSSQLHGRNGSMGFFNFSEKTGTFCVEIENWLKTIWWRMSLPACHGKRANKPAKTTTWAVFIHTCWFQTPFRSSCWVVSARNSWTFQNLKARWRGKQPQCVSAYSQQKEAVFLKVY